MKRIICILIALCMIIGITSCGKADKDTDTDTTQITPEAENKDGEPEKEDLPQEENVPEGDTAPQEEGTSQEPDSTGLLRADAEKTGADVSAAYVGFVTGETVDEVRACISESACGKEYGFLKDIPDDRIVIAGGCDVYCVVPTDENATVKVNTVEYSENGAKIIGDTIYTGDSKPIILVCNVSDIMPNSLVTVESGGEETSFSLFVSLKDGSMAYSGDTAINDFTIYEN